LYTCGDITSRYWKYGELNKVGSPTISNGIASGFSTSSYLVIPKSYISNDGYTYVFCFTPYEFSATQNIANKEYFFSLYLSKTGVVTTWSWASNAKVELFTASLNTKYWIKQYINGTSKTISYSTDGVNYTQVKSFTDLSLNPNDTTYSSGNLVVGMHSKSGTGPATSYIDLNNSYIQDKNGNYIWQYLYENTADNYDYVVHEYNYKVPQIGETYYVSDYKRL
jgi:hypothetical protein